MDPVARCEAVHICLPRLRLSATQHTALQERHYENPTIGILVVQVRRIRAISGDVFQPAAYAAFVTPLIFVPGFEAAANSGGLELIRRCSPA
jgi:hypothetical protein